MLTVIFIFVNHQIVVAWIQSTFHFYIFLFYLFLYLGAIFLKFTIFGLRITITFSHSITSLYIFLMSLLVMIFINVSIFLWIRIILHFNVFFCIWFNIVKWLFKITETRTTAIVNGWTWRIPCKSESDWLEYYTSLCHF